MTIPRIHIKEVDIPNIYTPDWMSRQSNVEHLVPPVVLNIGNPIVDMPGCVKMHRDNQYHNNGLPIDRNLVENDPDRAMTVCDAEVPSYDAMNFEPEQLIITRETPPTSCGTTATTTRTLHQMKYQMQKKSTMSWPSSTESR